MEILSTVLPFQITLTYIIWVGNEAYINYNMTMTVPQGTNFYTVMQLAAEKDENFE